MTTVNFIKEWSNFRSWVWPHRMAITEFVVLTASLQAKSDSVNDNTDDKYIVRNIEIFVCMCEHLSEMIALQQ